MNIIIFNEGKEMNCKMERGKFIFTDKGFKTYILGDKRHDRPESIVKEYKRLQHVKNAMDWSFPVVEAIQIEKTIY